MKLTTFALFLMLSLFFVSAYEQKQEEDPTSMEEDLQDYEEMEDSPYDEDYNEEDVDAADRSVEKTNRDLGYGYYNNGGYNNGYRRSYNSYGHNGGYSSRTYSSYGHYVQPRVVNRVYYNNYYRGGKGMGKGSRKN
jgi:hypothetical protein